MLFILADDLGAFDLSCYGRPDYKTPNIDSLARDGIKLSRAYANSSTCSPTRTALITGRYQNRLELGNYDPLPPGKDLGLPDGAPTLPRQFKRLGYVTALFGKWHMGGIPAHGPLRHGYDEFYGLPDGAMDYHTHDLGGGPFPSPVRTPQLYEGESLKPTEGYSTDLFTARAVEFITRKRSEPFFLSLHYNAPHWPWETRTERAEGKFADANFEGGSPAIYAEMVRILDEGVGKVLAGLKASGQERNTIVVFTSDNGGERFSFVWPLRGMKGTLYEGGLRVPAMVRWPGHIKPRAASDQVMMTMDWLATLLALCGSQPDAGFPTDGVNLAPHLVGGPKPGSRTLFWRTAGWRAALDGPWKYLVDDGGHEYLFNLDRDESEHANLRLREAARFEDLKARWAEWNASMTPVPADAPVSSPDFQRRLEAMELSERPRGPGGVAPGGRPQ